MPNEVEYLTPEEAAVKLKVDPETIRVQLRAGKLAGIKIGRQWRVLWPPQTTSKK